MLDIKVTREERGWIAGTIEGLEEEHKFEMDVFDGGTTVYIDGDNLEELFDENGDIMAGILYRAILNWKNENGYGFDDD
jgi:hypothetical protein